MNTKKALEIIEEFNQVETKIEILKESMKDLIKASTTKQKQIAAKLGVKEKEIIAWNYTPSRWTVERMKKTLEIIQKIEEI